MTEEERRMGVVARRHALGGLPVVFLLAVLAVLLVSAVPAAAAPPKPRPDLDLTSAEAGPRVIFQGEPEARLRICVEVRNVGRARTGRILATLHVDGPGVEAIPVRLSLDPLKAPTRPRRGGPLRFDSAEGCARGGATPISLPLGVYDIGVCVGESSRRERRYRNNCRTLTRHLYVVKRTWNATLSGQSSAGVLDLGFEKWQSNAMTFTFDAAQQNVAAGTFGYRLSAGSVTYVDQESATGCQRFGTLTDFGPSGRLTLDYLKNTYEAFGRVNEGFGFPINSLCEEAFQGPVTQIYLDTGIGVGPQPFPFGASVLAGSRGGPNDDQNYTWSFG